MVTKKRLAILLSISLMFSMVFGALTPALAKSTREAVIDSVEGQVNITKAGGSKSYRAFVGMTLNQGDHLETGVGANVVLRIVDHDDVITIDENTSLYISELSEDAKGKKSKVKMWAGSLWGKVKTLTGTDDEFTVETPTAVMGVQGTTLLVGVDPVTGESKFYIASGLGQVSKKGNEDAGSGTVLIPNQQISLYNDVDSSDYDNLLNIADLDSLISNSSNAIIEAIIASKAAMDQENAEYIDKLNEQGESAGEINQEAIDRINRNLDNLVGNIIKKAISQAKVDEASIRALVDKINVELDKKINLDDLKPQELTEQEKAKQAQIKLLEEERKKKLEAEKLKQDELKKQNEVLLKKLKDQLEKQKAEKSKAEEAAKKKATEELAKKMANEAAKLAFEAKQKALAEEKAKQDKAAADAAANQANSQTPTGSDSSVPPPTIKGKVTMGIEHGELYEPAQLQVNLDDFGTKEIHGIQLEFTYSSSVYYLYPDLPFSEQFISGIFGETSIETIINEANINNCGSDISCRKLMVVAVKLDTTQTLTADELTLLVTLPFESYSDAEVITLTKVVIVDRTGKVHEIEISPTTVTINQTIYEDD